MKIHQLRRDTADFQQPVDEEELRLQLDRELPDEKLVAVTELDSGWFNNTYRVRTSQNDYILKIAPGADAEVFYNERYLMSRERSVSQQLQSLSPLIPEYLSFFNVGDRSAFLQAFVEGRLWHEEYRSLSEDENARLWKQLGMLAKVLHSCRGETFGYPPPSEGFDRWSQFVADNVRGIVEDCRRLDVYCKEIEAYCACLPQFHETLDQVDSARLIHGDIWPRNIVFDGAGETIHLKALFDGERAFWGDPVSEWVLLLYDVPEAFWQGYGENLLETRDPACIAIYKGMYFILNILETTRFRQSAEGPRKHLAAVTKQLETILLSK